MLEAVSASPTVMSLQIGRQHAAWRACQQVGQEMALPIDQLADALLYAAERGWTVSVRGIEDQLAGEVLLAGRVYVALQFQLLREPRSQEELGLERLEELRARLPRGWGERLTELYVAARAKLRLACPEFAPLIDVSGRIDRNERRILSLLGGNRLLG